MSLKKNIIVLFLLIFVIVSCKTIDRKIDNLSKEDLLKEFQKTVISCKDIEFTLFGLSLATINTIISFILSVITFKLFLNYEKNR